MWSRCFLFLNKRKSWSKWYELGSSVIVHCGWSVSICVGGGGGEAGEEMGRDQVGQLTRWCVSSEDHLLTLLISSVVYSFFVIFDSRDGDLSYFYDIFNCYLFKYCLYSVLSSLTLSYMYLTYSFYATFYFFMFYSIGAWGQAKCHLNPRFVIPRTMRQCRPWL